MNCSHSSRFLYHFKSLISINASAIAKARTTPPTATNRIIIVFTPLLLLHLVVPRLIRVL